jgi:hypothetical protein
MKKYVVFRNKKTNLTLPMDYIIDNQDKIVVITHDMFGKERLQYNVKEIPFNEDWELEIHYFTDEDLNKIFMRRIDDAIERKIFDLRKREK